MYLTILRTKLPNVWFGNSLVCREKKNCTKLQLCTSVLQITLLLFAICMYVCVVVHLEYSVETRYKSLLTLWPSFREIYFGNNALPAIPIDFLHNFQVRIIFYIFHTVIYGVQMFSIIQGKVYDVQFNCHFIYLWFCEQRKKNSHL